MRNYNCGGLDGVWIHCEPVPHFTIWDKIEERKKKWFMYEVSPIGKIHRGNWDDIICTSATVVKNLGNAWGILENWKKRNPPKQLEKQMAQYHSHYPPEDYVLHWNYQMYVHWQRWRKMKKVY